MKPALLAGRDMVWSMRHLKGANPAIHQSLRRWGAWVSAVMLGFILSFGFSGPAQAMTQLSVSEIGYEECPADVSGGNVTSDGSARPADCYLIFGTVTNSTNKVVYDADVFGRVYDATHNSVMENRTRLGGIKEVPPGKSKFEIRISVPASQPAPLQLEQFKASGFASSVRNQLVEPDYFDDELEDY